jgi:EamA domain-containing membrane protein RarD
MLELLTHHILAASNPAETLVTTIKLYIGPFLLLVIGVMAFKFISNNQITAFITFIVCAVIVAVLFYYPGIIESIAGSFYNTSGASGWN